MIPLAITTINEIAKQIAGYIMPSPIGQGALLVILFLVIFMRNRVGTPLGLMMGVLMLHTVQLAFGDVYTAFFLTAFSLGSMALILLILVVKNK